ncbi:MAG TPA: hypothetical protein V6D15_11150 [Oculatellaceae cyanobacterium]
MIRGLMPLGVAQREWLRCTWFTSLVIRGLMPLGIAQAIAH